MANSVSPASSGPAGNQFEAQVGASYLLALLTGSEPRGLRETRIDSVKLQRAAEGHPLDDVIVTAHDAAGAAATLEIQVKRSITFAPSDEVFASVVNQVVNAARQPSFWEAKHELAVATARTSRKIDGAYQDVLTWARQLGSATTFAERIARPGSASDDMRTFVATFRSHLKACGYPDDDETVWKLLRRFQILVFDFTAQGSASEALARDRAAHALEPADAAHAGTLWSALVELALDVAASGGDRTRDTLRAETKLTPFRLAAEHRHATALAALAESARNALADISDRIGGASLTRHERVAAVHAQLDSGRYVEIRGDAGVGKSGILKHFAEQAAFESQVIVLSPGRTIPRGWTAMRDVLGFEGTARELLAEVATNGGAILFVDNLDLFSKEERATVNDLVRDAAAVPGFAVVVTARRDFGVDEVSWLDSGALDILGRTSPVMVGELSDAELAELRAAAPQIASLLSDAHPAREVTRNLFRLGRLAGQASGAPVAQTELDMAEQWWRTADGDMDAQHRERARLIRTLAEQAVLQVSTFDVSAHPAEAVDALIKSETLRDFGNDRVGFRHDVLREWAVAGLLSSDPDARARLPLSRPAPAFLARGVELFARAAIERAADDRQWQALLEDFSGDAHGSWRRAVLLALVRSEAAPVLLARAADSLLADEGVLLRELIRIIRAVDVEAAAKLYELVGLEVGMVPTSLNVPSGPSWFRLIHWLLGLGDRLPAACIPHVVDLYIAWCQGMLGLDPLTPELLKRFYGWLTEIEAARDAEFSRDRRAPFGGTLTDQQLRSLEEDLRTGFVLFAHRVPDLAAEYLRGVQKRDRRADIAETILKFRGSLAAAAPAELADLTASALIPPKRPARGSGRPMRERPFDFLDNQFLPASPAQGPFFELLTSAPQIALPLIRRLVDYAISYYAKGAEPGTDVITLTLPGGERAFPWQRSYNWSRESGPHYAVTSALMALEAWGHRRVEAGESVETVVSDVLGDEGAPVAFLLVAVDLILSHWPASCDAGVPLLASPELLCLDRERQVHDNVEYPDFFGLKELQKEPTGAATLESLKARPSRGASLDQLIGYYAVSDAVEARERLRDLLRAAAKRLGPPRSESNLGDPEFMVLHALNLADPENWPEREMDLPDGSKRRGHAYVSPQSEIDHLAPLQGLSRERLQDTNIQAAIGVLLEDPTRSSPESVLALVEWARRQNSQSPSETDDDEDGRDSEWLREQAVMGAAMIAMRDGDASLRAESREWAHQVFHDALNSKDDPVHRSRAGLRFNPIAIAFAGMAYALKDRAEPADIRALLDIAARDNPAGAHGFRATASELAAFDERLPRAILRCAFAARRFVRRDWEQPEEEFERQTAQLRKEVDRAVQADADWLAGSGAEPAWPDFPSENPQPRHRLRLPGAAPSQPVRPRRARQDEYPDSQGAALWLNSAAALVDVRQRPWLRDIVRAYLEWTREANGAELDDDDDIDRTPGEWNNAYFALLANCLPGLAPAEIDALALDPIIALPDRAFLDVAAHFLRSVDLVFFNGGALQAADMVHIRSRLAERLVASYAWRRFAENRSDSLERDTGETVAAFFFNQYGYFQPPTCYLLEKAIERIDPFLPGLGALVAAAPNVFLALVTMNLLEVAPKPTHLAFALTAAKAWVASHPDNTDFWIDHGIGRRFCHWLENIRQQAPALFAADVAQRRDLDQILAALVRAGVPEAGRLEADLI